MSSIIVVNVMDIIVTINTVCQVGYIKCLQHIRLFYITNYLKSSVLFHIVLSFGVFCDLVNFPTFHLLRTV